MSNIPYFEVVDAASDAINPMFVGLFLEEPLLGTGTPRERWIRTLTFWARVSLCLGTAVVLAELGKKYQIWPGHPNFPSGHTTFATAAAVCIIMQRGKPWVFFAVSLAVLMGIFLVYDHWHTPDEVLGGWVLGTLIPSALWRLSGGPRYKRSQEKAAPTS